MATKVERRRLRFDDFDTLTREVEQLLAKGYTSSGDWSLGQCTEHLALVIEKSMDGFPSMLPAPLRWLIRWLHWKKIVNHEPFYKRVPAPKYLMPANAVEDRVGVEHLKAAVARFKKHTGSMHPSPAFGKLTYDEWRTVHLWHSEHHISFLNPQSAVA